MNKIYLSSIIIILFLLFNLQAFSQNGNAQNIEKYNNLEWNTWLEKVEGEYKFKFFYKQNSIPNFTVVLKKDSSFKKQLSLALSPYLIKVSIDDNNNVFLLKNTEIETNIYADFYKKQDYSISNMLTKDDYINTQNELITKTIVLGKKNNKKDGKLTVKGIVRDFYDKSLLVGATVFIQELGIALYTDENGAFSTDLDKGEYVFIIKDVESKEEKYKVTIHSSGSLEFYLETKLILLDEVVIRSDEFHNVRSNQMGLENISAKSIELIPAVLGEKDIIKVSLLLPGIQSVGEGSAGINVRGSPTDQNIFYLDNIPIYNTSHFFGFFSSINSDAIDNFKIYKSNIPSEYGGRLSAVVDIDSKTGNKDKYTASGGISPVTGRLTLEGPLGNKGSFLIGGRSTYSDWILDLIENEDVANSNAKFADGILNTNYDINKNNKLKLTAYYSYDKINFAGINNYDYENLGVSVSWKHFNQKKLSTEVFLVYSDYLSSEENYEDSINSFMQNFRINHNEIKVKNSYRPNSEHNIIFGLNSIFYYLDKGSSVPLGNESLFPAIDFGISKAVEAGLFVDHEWTVSPVFSLMSGFRYNFYAVIGSGDIYEYQENSVKKESTIIDTLHVVNNSVVKTYQNPDFRISAKYLINNYYSVKIGYNSIHQYSYMLSNTIAISPFYKWQLSDYHIEPMSGQQISLGLYSNFRNSMYEFSVETYYKQINNLVQFRDGANISFNEIIETDVLQGELSAYGIELMLKKKYGKLNGNVNYTYSNSQNIVESEILENNINYGIPYNADYDKPHAINLAANYEFVKRFSASVNFVYSTGRSITYPTGVYYYSGIKFFNYTRRNEYRIPDYIRLDASIKFEGNLHSKKLLHGTWMLSAYNLLGRNNAYSVFFKEELGVINSYKLSIFANPIVSLSYNFNLGNYENK